MTNGIRVTQEGISVKRAAEYQMALDDRWPLMDFLFTGVIEVNYRSLPGGGDLAVPLFTHNLGFTPGFFAKVIQIRSVSAGVLYNSPGDIKFYSDPQTAWGRFFRRDGASTAIETISAVFYVGILDRDFTQTYQAPSTVIPANATSGASPYGMKVLNNQGLVGMRSNNKSDYNLHTNAKPLGIHMHGVMNVGQPQNFQMRIRHNLGYPPTYMVTAIQLETFSGSPSFNKRIINALDSQDPGKGKSTSTELTISGAQSALNGDFMYIILKDPVDIAR